MKAGVHLPNDGELTAEDLRLLEGLGLVKGLLRLDTMGAWGEIDWPLLAGHLRPDCSVILRLYFPGYLDPDEFTHRAAVRLGQVLPALETRDREILIEIHNEPNHVEGIEGWGAASWQAEQFAWWFYEVREGLRLRGYRRLGWPGLAVGEWLHRERTWAEVCRPMIEGGGWVGVHCYWQQPGELNDPRLGGNWAWYRQQFRRRRLFVTECGNSLGTLSPAEQCAQYRRWCELAQAGGVAGVAFYMLGGSDEWSPFRLQPETVRALYDFQ